MERFIGFEKSLLFFSQNDFFVFQGYSVRRVEMKESSSVYMTLAFAGVALMAAMIVGVVVIRRRNGRHPHHQVHRPFGNGL